MHHTNSRLTVALPVVPPTQPLARRCFPCRPWSHCSCPLLPPAPAAPVSAPLQGDFLDQAAELIVKQYKEVQKGDVFYIDAKKKQRFFDVQGEDD